ncbi:hypothetical protein ACTMU2_12345 [Cupriavidus basilensis]
MMRAPDMRSTVAISATMAWTMLSLKTGRGSGCKREEQMMADGVVKVIPVTGMVWAVAITADGREQRRRRPSHAVVRRLPRVVGTCTARQSRCC